MLRLCVTRMKVKSMKSQRELSDASFAIWIGDLSSYTEVDNFLRDEFSEVFGFRLDAEGLEPEIDGGESKPIEELLQPFSSSRDFVQAAADLAVASGISSAQCAVVFYGMRYDESLETKYPGEEHPLRFLGNVPFPESS